jgi:hypothetical protein
MHKNIIGGFQQIVLAQKSVGEALGLHIGGFNTFTDEFLCIVSPFVCQDILFRGHDDRSW